VRDLGLRNYHAAEARETQRRNRLLRLSLLDGLRLEDDEPSILPEGSQRLLALLALKGRPIRRPVVGGHCGRWPLRITRPPAFDPRRPARREELALRWRPPATRSDCRTRSPWIWGTRVV